MKKYLCILILALCASLLPVSPALADTVSWVRITQDNTRFYRNPTNMDADIMFELEKSYYLKVVSEQSYFYQVELMDNDNGFVKIYGYVKKTDVTPCDTVPELPLYSLRSCVPWRSFFSPFSYLTSRRILAGFFDYTAKSTCATGCAQDKYAVGGANSRRRRLEELEFKTNLLRQLYEYVQICVKVTRFAHRSKQI